MLREVTRAADAIHKAKALVITAGAGMGVDSGLPDFRGAQGFWRAYPPLKDKGIQLTSMSTPHWFRDDPQFAWGFFGHRYNLYNRTTPHQGFQILRKWGEGMSMGYFVFTSNVDGHFQKAGMAEDRIVECHGSIHYLQSRNQIWPMPANTVFNVDMTTLRASSPLPMGPPGKEDTIARPNILMFDDYEFLDDRINNQYAHYDDFVRTLSEDVPFVVIEIGAGLAVPTVRWTSESLVSRRDKRGTLIRINPREPEVPSEKCVSIDMGGLQSLRCIEDIMANL